MVEMTPEEQEMQENIKNMSPEELAEFQKQQCIFCQIMSGKVQSKKIYEDSKCMAILDINPANPGHILLLPREHYAIMPLIPDEEISHLFMVSKALSNAMLKGLKVTGTNIFVANGPIAGQRAQHFMIHIIPRKENDGVSCFNIPQRQIPESDLETIKKRMVQATVKVFKLKESDIESEKPAEKEEELVPVKKEEERGGQGVVEKREEKKDAAKEAANKPQTPKKPGADLDKVAGLFK